MSATTTNVLLVGVGGQGVLVASETLALAAVSGGFQTKQSEVHGVAQRGGTVVSHVRFGEKVHSPLARRGEVDVLYALEQVEALRFAHYVREGGMVVMDDRLIEPIALSDAPPPPAREAIFDFLSGHGYDVHVIPALVTATHLGDERCANIVLLGALAAALPIPEASWQDALHQRFPEKLRPLNVEAFSEGRRLAAAGV